jgi:hypothetical protein
MRDPIVDRPDLTEIVGQIRDLAARTPELVVTITLKEPVKRRRRMVGAGSIVRKVSRGYVTYKPRVVVARVVHWGPGVGVKAGVSEDHARARAAQNLRNLLADVAKVQTLPAELG